MNHVEFLRDNILFKDMSDTEIEEALRFVGAGTRKYLTGEYIFREGDKIKYAGIVLEGCVKVIREDYYGNCDILGQMPAHGLFGEALCFCGAEELPVSIVANEDSKILLLKLKGSRLPEKLQRNLLSEISSKVLMLTNKLRIIQNKKTSDKLMSFLRSEAKMSESSEFDIPYTRQELADYLGVERSAMIVELSKLKAEGYFYVRGKHFKLLK